MIRILLADDDAAVTSGLAAMLKSSMENVHIKTCNHGIETFESLMQERFDLLITDVRMPGMTGLEILENMAQRGIDVPALVISGYENFAYVRKAMQFGAVDYLLKPVKTEELLRAVCGVVGNREEKSRIGAGRASGEDVAGYLIEQNWEPRQAVKLELENDLAGASWQVVLMVPREQQRTDTDGEWMTVLRASERYFVRLHDGGVCILRPNSKTAFDGTHLGAWMTIYESDAPCAAEEIPRLVAVLQKQVRRTFFDIRLTEPPTIRAAEEWLSQAAADMKQMDDGACAESIEAALYVMIEGGADRADIVRALMNWFYHLMGENTDLIRVVSKYDLTERCFLVEVQRRDTLSSLCTCIETILSLYIGELRRGADRRLTQIERVKQYVREHLGESIQIGDAAQEIGVHPNYLSTIFKKTTGSSFREYLRDERIQAARKMLKTTDLKIYEIAEMVGYADPAHFSRAFKQVTGHAPQSASGSTNRKHD